MSIVNVLFFNEPDDPYGVLCGIYDDSQPFSSSPQPGTGCCLFYKSGNLAETDNGTDT